MYICCGFSDVLLVLGERGRKGKKGKGDKGRKEGREIKECKINYNDPHRQSQRKLKWGGLNKVALRCKREARRVILFADIAANMNRRRGRVFLLFGRFGMGLCV